MLMDIKCSVVNSILIHLDFDNDQSKEVIISKGDIINVEYNKNGMRLQFTGEIINISCQDTNSKNWAIIVDGSGDFESDKARINVMNILDIDIIYKKDDIGSIQTPTGPYSVPYLRIVKGRLQYSHDGYDWRPISVDSRDVIIKNESGTYPGPEPGPAYPPYKHPRRKKKKVYYEDDDDDENTGDENDGYEDDDYDDTDDDGIFDENYDKE